MRQSRIQEPGRVYHPPLWAQILVSWISMWISNRHLKSNQFKSENFCRKACSCFRDQNAISVNDLLKLQVSPRRSPVQNPPGGCRDRVPSALARVPAHALSLLALPAFLTSSSTLVSSVYASPETLAFLLLLENLKLVGVAAIYTFCYLYLEYSFSASCYILFPTHSGLWAGWPPPKCLLWLPCPNDCSPAPLIVYFVTL